MLGSCFRKTDKKNYEIILLSEEGYYKELIIQKQIQEQQTKKFVEPAVDDISMHLLKNFVDLAMKSNKY